MAASSLGLGNRKVRGLACAPAFITSSKEAPRQNHRAPTVTSVRTESFPQPSRTRAACATDTPMKALGLASARHRARCTRPMPGSMSTRNSPTPQEPEGQHEKWPAWADKQRDAISPLDAQGGQPSRAYVALLVEFIEANRPIGEDVCRLRGAIDRGRAQERGEIARLKAALAAHTGSSNGCAARNERTSGTMRSAASSST